MDSIGTSPGRGIKIVAVRLTAAFAKICRACGVPYSRGPTPYLWPENGANKVGKGGGNVLNGVTSWGYVDPLDLELLEGMLFATHDLNAASRSRAVTQYLDLSP